MTQKNGQHTVTSDSLVILSVGHAQELVEVAFDEKDYYLVQQICQSILVKESIVGDADDYHNLSVVISRADDYSTAYLIVEKGLLQFPYNIDLLADAIYYGSNSKQYKKCEEYILTLRSRPFAHWNWRAFSFLVDYYLAKSDWTEKIDELFDNTEDALNIAKAFQEILPNEERAYICEYKVRMEREKFYRAKESGVEAKNEKENAEGALKRAIESEKFSAVQCCLKYADLLFEEQRYTDVINICIQALQYGESQPSARLGYFLYLSGQSKDILIHREQAYEETERVKDAFTDYIAAYRVFNYSSSYKSNIRDRVMILSIKSSLPLPSVFVENG